MKRKPFLQAGEEEIQQPVLIDPDRVQVRHLLLHFPHDVRPTEESLRIASPAHFLAEVLKMKPGLASVAAARANLANGTRPLLMNIGFTFQGLRRLKVPPHIQTCLTLKAPAFAAGSPLRAAAFAADTGASDPALWNAEFALHHLHAVITLHADLDEEIDKAIAHIERLANALTPPVDIRQLPPGKALLGREKPPLVHFDVRDGLSRVEIRRWDDPDEVDQPPVKKISRHEIGEFVLGYPEDTKANPWIRDLAGRILPARTRDFFRHGSFGVLRQMAQDTVGFANYVKGTAAEHKSAIGIDDEAELHGYVMSRLIGRWPDGKRSSVSEPIKEFLPADADFDYHGDPKGHGCPLGAHMRRMNPRGTPIAQQAARPVMRRGMPYGPRCTGRKDDIERGLLGLFFCASIEEQFEHLLGQWADRVPLGSPDTGDAKDPLVGDNAHDARFVVPRPDAQPLVFSGLSSFVTTRGMAYLFYPALSTTRLIVESDYFADQQDLPR